jgi:hypothetical protein
MRGRYGRRNPHALSAGNEGAHELEKKENAAAESWEKGRSDFFAINALLFFLASLLMLV